MIEEFKEWFEHYIAVYHNLVRNTVVVVDRDETYYVMGKEEIEDEFYFTMDYDKPEIDNLYYQYCIEDMQKAMVEIHGSYVLRADDNDGCSVYDDNYGKIINNIWRIEQLLFKIEEKIGN